MRDFLTSASKGDSIEAAAALEGVVWIQKVSALFLGCLKSQDILYIISDLLPSSRRTLQLKVAEDVSTLVKVKVNWPAFICCYSVNEFVSFKFPRRRLMNGSVKFIEE